MALKSLEAFSEYLLTLFHVASNPTYFTLGGQVSSPPPSNFVIFKDKDFKFGEMFIIKFEIKVSFGI